MQIFTTNGSTDSENFLTQISRPSEIEKVIPGYGKRMDFLAEYRKFTDEAGQANGQRPGGSGDLKLIARIPEALLIGIMAVEPDFLKDKKNIYKWLDANPEYAAYTRKKRTK